MIAVPTWPAVATAVVDLSVGSVVRYADDNEGDCL